MVRPRKPPARPDPAAIPRSGRVYTLDVTLADGPPPAGADADISRTVQLRGDQTLEVLHQVISEAFDRRGDFSYEFQFEAGPLHPEGKRYVLPAEYEVSVAAGNQADGRVTDTPLDALSLEPGVTFSYWPDFDDDRWHPVTVRAVTAAGRGVTYPRITHRKGESPYQRGDSGPEKPAKGAKNFGPEEGADTACLIGDLHLSKGEYQQAIEAFSRAIENRPTADAYQGRAKAYRALAALDEQAATKLR